MGRIASEWWVELERNDGSDNSGIVGRNGPEYSILRGNALFLGIESQIDTYFQAQHGYLKMRESRLETYLVHYQSESLEGFRKCTSLHCKWPVPDVAKEILTRSLGVLAIVEKRRATYLIDNIKIHIDHVEQLGTFVKLEITDNGGALSTETQAEQGRRYIDLLGMATRDVVSESYCDLALKTVAR